MSFKDIALPLASRGIPVVPIAAGAKYPRMDNWPALATTDPAQIEDWDQVDPSANVGCVAKSSGAYDLCLLDCDAPNIPELIEQATGQKLPDTFTVLSASRRAPHFYYRHTAKSRALGNRSWTGRFDFYAHNKQCVGPGSMIVTDNGPRSYDTVRDSQIANIPDWLVDWIASVSQPEKHISSKDLRRVSENFDIDKFLTHYGLSYHKKGVWYVPDVCPVAGRKHKQSTETAFRYDGLSLGFKCFASSCAGSSMSVGEVIKHLNKGDGTKLVAPYLGEIWPKPETVLDPEVVAADWFEPSEKLAADPIPERKNLLLDSKTGATVLYSESVNQIFAKRGLGKSVFMFGLTGCLLNGGEFLQYKSAGNLKVLYCDGELPKALLQKRLKMLIPDGRERLVFMHAKSVPNQSFPRLSDPQWQGEFLKRVEKLQPDVIVFDTLTACFRFDTNKADQWDSVNQFYITLRNKGYCVVVIHHEGKLSATSRGLTNGEDNLDLCIRLSAPKDWAPGDGCRFHLSYDKVREGGHLPDFGCSMDENGKWSVDNPQDDPEKMAVLDLYMQSKTYKAISHTTEVPVATVGRWIKQALATDMIKPRTVVVGGKKKKGE